MYVPRAQKNELFLGDARRVLAARQPAVQRGLSDSVITISFSWKARELSCELINNEEKGVYMFSPSWVSRSICPIPLPGNT